MKKLQADEILVSSKVSEQSKYDNIYNKYNMCLKKTKEEAYTSATLCNKVEFFIIKYAQIQI